MFKSFNEVDSRIIIESLIDKIRDLESENAELGKKLESKRKWCHSVEEKMDELTTENIKLKASNAALWKTIQR